METQIPYLGGSFGAMLLTAPGVLAEYARLLLLPVPLAAEYEVTTVVNPTDWRLLAAAAVLLPLAGLLAASARRSAGVALAAGWTLLTLLPVSHLVPIANPVAERFLYAPAVGVGLLLATGLAWVLRSSRSRSVSRWAVCVCLALGGSSAALTAARNHVWLTERTLYRDTLRKCATSQRFQVNLGEVYMEANRPVMAAAQFARALAKQGTHGPAVAAFGQCLALKPEHARAHHQIAACYTALRLYERALQHFRRALELAPKDERARRNLRELERFLERKRSQGHPRPGRAPEPASIPSAK